MLESEVVRLTEIHDGSLELPLERERPATPDEGKRCEMHDIPTPARAGHRMGEVAERLVQLAREQQGGRGIGEGSRRALLEAA